MRLLKKQETVAREYLDSTIFLEGIAGTGKTTAAIERIKHLIREGVPVDSILVIVPQMALGLPYRDAIRRSRVETNGADIQTATLGSLAFQMVDLFWALIADDVGFENPLERPHFLSLELVQYYMTRFVEPMIESNDYFNSVTINRSRLYTQIVDNLNKAALVRFNHENIAERLKSAWDGEVEQGYIYDDTQSSASLFRDVCIHHNMLDFSLQVSLFVDFLWKHPAPRNYLTKKYRHLIIDNIEEDTPATHDILTDWIKQCESALVIYDSKAGYRRFLGADPINAYTLKQLCQHHIEFDNHRVMSDDLMALEIKMAESLKQPIDTKLPKDSSVLSAIEYPADPSQNRFQPQMLDWAVEHIESLIHSAGVNPSEIVVLAPYLPDALKFALQTRMNEKNIPNRSHRPSRALREEPSARTLLTLAKIAHPIWEIPTDNYAVAYALMSAIDGLDLVRAQLLVEILYRNGELLPFAQIQNETVQERITFDLGNRYDHLRQWLQDYKEQDDPLVLDAFLSKLFGEVLSQPHFGFHNRHQEANTAANLIDSARQFRQTVSKIEPQLDTASEYVQMVDRGVIANLYMRDWEASKEDAVLIAPAYTFLLSNQPVEYQFWLNVGSTGWAQRLNQPLTHPYVMSRQWQQGRKWTDADEVEANQETLSNLVLGLIRRCRKKIYLGFSEFSEQGYEQRGALLMAVHSMLRRLRQEQNNV